MKRILSILMAAVLLVSAIPTAFAAENEADYTAGTQVELIGSQEAAAGGAGDVWTVTVPAKMTLGDTGTVKAEGMWSSNKVLHITAPSSVALNYGAQSLTADITGGCMILPGSDVNAVLGEGEVSVSKYLYDSDDNFYTKVLFGTWEGTLNYTVNLVTASVSRGDANGDGIISNADAVYISQVLSGKIQLSDDERADVIARADMNSDGNLATDDANTISLILCGALPIE